MYFIKKVNVQWESIPGLRRILKYVRIRISFNRITDRQYSYKNNRSPMLCLFHWLILWNSFSPCVHRGFRTTSGSQWLERPR